MCCPNHHNNSPVTTLVPCFASCVCFTTEAKHRARHSDKEMQISSSIPLICSVRVKAFMRQGRFFGASPVSGCLLSPSGRWDPRRSPPALSSASQPAETLLQGHKHTMSGSGCILRSDFFCVCKKCRNTLLVEV